jgi:hypothetical protein
MAKPDTTQLDHAAIKDGHLTGTVVKSNKTLNPYISRFILAGGSLA